MRKSITEIEAWAIHVHDHVTGGHQNEDSRVELKSVWPTDFHKTARRIAGHANASRGEPILWIIGLDKNGNVLGAKENDLAKWWQQVCAEFDGPVPKLTDVIVHTRTPLVALYLEVDQPPYLIKTPPDVRGKVLREVPWREGTSVATATHADLIRILDPIRQCPSLEILGGNIQYFPSEPNHARWTIWFRLYVIPTEAGTVVIRAHDCRLNLSCPQAERKDSISVEFEQHNDHALHVSPEQAMVLSPDSIKVKGSWSTEPWVPDEVASFSARFSAKPIYCDREIELPTLHFERDGTGRGNVRQWRRV